MGRVIAFFRRALRLLRLRSNPFSAYQVVSDTPRAELEVVLSNQDRVVISVRCKSIQPISYGGTEIHEVYEVSATCSDTAPDLLKSLCKMELMYPQIRKVPLRGSDITEVLIDHYLQVLNFQLNVTRS